MMNGRQSFFCVCVCECAIFAMNGSLINSKLHILIRSRHYTFIRSKWFLWYVTIAHSHLFFVLMCARVCEYVFVKFYWSFCWIVSCCVVSCHVMKFNFDKYSFGSAIGLDARICFPESLFIFIAMQKKNQRERERRREVELRHVGSNINNFHQHVWARR